MDSRLADQHAIRSSNALRPTLLLEEFAVMIARVRWLVCLALCTACSANSRKIDVDLLSTDAHINVAGHNLVVPFVALPTYISKGHSFSLDRSADLKHARERLRSFRAAAATRPGATLDSVRVSTFQYGNFGELRAASAICPRLTRTWARKACTDSWDPLLQAMPTGSLWLVDLGKPESFDHHSTVGGERVSEQLESMRQIGDRASIACDRKRGYRGVRFCTAAVRVDQSLGAVWFVWEGRDEAETAVEMAEREGKMIIAFVRYGLGETEQYSRLKAVACQLRRPKRSKPTPDDRCDLKGPRTSAMGRR